MAAFRLLLACCVLLVFPMFSDTLPEPGKLNMEFKTYDNFLGFSKALYKGATISVKGTCFSAEKNRPKITISWKLKYTQCADLFASVKENSQLQNVWVGFPNHEMYGEDTVECNNNILLKDMSSQPERIVNDTHPEAAESQKDDVADEGIENKKRDDKEKQTKGKEENKDKNKLQIKKDGGSSGVKKESNEVNHSTQNANKGKKGKGKAAKPGDTNKANGNNEQNNSNAKNQDKNGKKAKGKSVNRQERSVEMKVRCI